MFVLNGTVNIASNWFLIMHGWENNNGFNGKYSEKKKKSDAENVFVEFSIVSFARVISGFPPNKFPIHSNLCIA